MLCLSLVSVLPARQMSFLASLILRACGQRAVSYTHLVHREFPLHKARLLLKTPAYALHGEISRTLPGETRTLPLPFAFSSMGGLPADFGGRRDPLLCMCAQQVPRLRYKLFEECEYLVFPLQVGGRMDFTAFFCLVTPVWLEGALYGVLCVDREGEARRFVPAV